MKLNDFVRFGEAEAVESREGVCDVVMDRRIAVPELVTEIVRVSEMLVLCVIDLGLLCDSVVDTVTIAVFVGLGEFDRLPV